MDWLVQWKNLTISLKNEEISHLGCNLLFFKLECFLRVTYSHDSND